MALADINIEERKKWDLRSGNTVRVWQKIREGEKTRLQAFEGLLIAHKHGFETGATFTVRKNSGGIGVERIFPVFSPNIDRVEIIKRSKVRRSKLYYIREKTTKQIRKKMKQLKNVLSEKESKVEEEKDESVEPTEELKVGREETEVSEDKAADKTDSAEKKEEENAPEKEEVLKEENNKDAEEESKKAKEEDKKEN